MLPGGNSLTLDCASEESKQITRRALQGKLSLFDTRNIKHLLNQVCKMLALLRNASESISGKGIERAILRPFQLQDFRKALDDRDRGTQFMIGNREKVIFVLFQTFLHSDVLKNNHSACHDPIICIEWCAGCKRNHFAPVWPDHQRFFTFDGITTEGTDHHKIPGEDGLTLRRLLFSSFGPGMLVERHLNEIR